MTLNFCPKCKAIIVPRTIDGKTIMLCNSCGWWREKKGAISLKISEGVKKSSVGEGVADADKDVDERATYEHVCEKCGYDKAEVWDAGVQISDEDELIMLKCGKCGYVERIGRKVS